MHTFGVPFSFMGNSWVSFLKPTLWMYLSLYSQVTFSLMACPLLSPPFFVGDILPGLSWKDSMHLFGEKPLQFFFTRLFILLLLHAEDSFYFFVLCRRKLCYTLGHRLLISLREVYKSQLVSYLPGTDACCQAWWPEFNCWDSQVQGKNWHP